MNPHQLTPWIYLKLPVDTGCPPIIWHRFILEVCIFSLEMVVAGCSRRWAKFVQRWNCWSQFKVPYEVSSINLDYCWGTRNFQVLEALPIFIVRKWLIIRLVYCNIVLWLDEHYRIENNGSISKLLIYFIKSEQISKWGVVNHVDSY